MKTETRERLRELFEEVRLDFPVTVHRANSPGRGYEVCLPESDHETLTHFIAKCPLSSEASLIAALLNARDEILGEGNDG